MFEIAWRDALTAGVGRLSGRDPDALLFYEDREDLRITLENGAVREHFLTQFRGCSARREAFEVHASNPEPDDVCGLAAAAAAGKTGAAPATVDDRTGNLPNPSAPEGSLDSDRAVRALRAVWERIERLRAGRSEEFEASVHWIGFRQHVMSIRPGREVTTDLRESARIRIAVRALRRCAEAEVTADQVIRVQSSENSIAALADGVVGRALQRFDARSAPRGDQAAVFAPGVGGILVHELVGHALEADTVQSGGSALARSRPGMIPPAIVVMDDPRRGRAAWRWDDEGEEARAVPLLQSGRVAGSLHDLRSARRARKPTTGHGRRSTYLEPVRPRMGCTFLAPGSDGPEEIVRSTSRGVYVRRLESAGTDPASGRAFFRVTDADRIQNGRIEEPLHPFLICLDGLRALSMLDRVADDLAFDTCIGACVRDGQPLATSVGTPTCRVGLISVFH